jgi:hypothetical protein
MLHTYFGESAFLGTSVNKALGVLATRFIVESSLL